MKKLEATLKLIEDLLGNEVEASNEDLMELYQEGIEPSSITFYGKGGISLTVPVLGEAFLSTVFSSVTVSKVYKLRPISSSNLLGVSSKITPNSDIVVDVVFIPQSREEFVQGFNDACTYLNNPFRPVLP